MSILRKNTCWEFSFLSAFIPWVIKKLCLWCIWKRFLRLEAQLYCVFKLFTSCRVTSTVNLDRTLLSVYLMMSVYLAKGPSSWGSKKKLIRVLEVTAYFSMCRSQEGDLFILGWLVGLIAFGWNVKIQMYESKKNNASFSLWRGSKFNE